MSNNWAIIGTADRVEREEQGFKLLKEDTIKCANCLKKLISIIKVKEDDKINTAIRARCPYCNDQSFWYKVSGKIYIQAVEDLSIVDMPVRLQNAIYFTNVELIKNG